jgi:hypothetical protein
MSCGFPTQNYQLSSNDGYEMRTETYCLKENRTHKQIRLFHSCCFKTASEFFLLCIVQMMKDISSKPLLKERYYIQPSPLQLKVISVFRSKTGKLTSEQQSLFRMRYAYYELLPPRFYYDVPSLSAT